MLLSAGSRGRWSVGSSCGPAVWLSVTIWPKSPLGAVRKFAGVALAERVCRGQAGPAGV